jgi:peptide/nickel transport system permease protein
MPGYVFRRVLITVIAFFVISLIVFKVFDSNNLTEPIIPIEIKSPHSEPESIVFIYFIERCYPERYVRWMGDFLTGDWGESIMPASYYTE